MARDIALLHPDLQAIIKEFKARCEAQGLPVLITETLRSVAEQDALYAKGRTAPGPVVTQCKGAQYESCHQWGIAFDFCRNVKGREWDNSDGFFAKVGAVGKALGLDWGGDWTGFVDLPHLQMRRFSPNGTATWLKTNYGRPEAFIATWTAAKKEDDYMVETKTITIASEKVAVESILHKDTLYVKVQDFGKSKALETKWSAAGGTEINLRKGAGV